MITRNARDELSTQHQVRKNISDILFDDQMNFPDLFRNEAE